MHCVDCVAQAAQASRGTRSALGAPVRQGPAVVTITIIVLCVASFLAQRAVPSWTNQWAFSPLAGYVEPWRFLTSAFLHATGTFGFTHILFNMVALWMVGPYLEATLGRLRYVALYVLSAIGGSVGVVVAALLTQSGLNSGVVGASGAVFGLFGAVLVVVNRLGGNARGILGVIAVNVVIGFVVPGIAWQAHLGGLVTGAVLGAVFAYAPAALRRVAGLLAPVAVALVLGAVAWVAYSAPVYRLFLG